MKELLRIENLKVGFARGEVVVPAVREVSFTVGQGECVALVGESGSGKTQIFMAALGLAARQARIDGSVRFEGDELLGAPPAALNRVRGSKLAMVFQDPMNALTPHLAVGEQLCEVLSVHGGGNGPAARAAALAMMARVGIGEPERRARQFPHELSGGLRQRVLIAMALLGRPKLLIADEPTTALDVSVQAQILALLKSLREETGLALVFISHDLAVIAAMADRVLVLYAGRIVESAPVQGLLRAPAHPYSAALIACMPHMHDALGETMPTLPGYPPRAGEEPTGCAFAPRCPGARARCASESPALRTHGGREVACHFPLGP